MKNLLKLFVVIAVAAITMTGCQKHPPTPPTPIVPPTLTILGQSHLTKTGVDIKISIKANDAKFSELGICYATTKNPTVSSARTKTSARNGITTVSLSDLTPNTKYYYRVYGVDDQGTTYYSDSIQRAWTYGLMDIDGNGYHTVKIGNYTFTVENLRTIHYRNGDLIPVITGNLAWHNATTGARCYYDNDSTRYDSTYGALYNFYAVRDPRGLAPQGWHVPTYTEYVQLWRDISRPKNLGGMMKEAGTKHWKAPNTGATNSTGFTGLPAGGRGKEQDGKISHFNYLGTNGVFWTSTREPAAPGSATIMELKYNWAGINIGEAMNYSYGFSVRLMKNQ